MSISNIEKSPINYSYISIKLTQSRIDKGLLAIPRSLRELFPDQNRSIQIYFDGCLTSELKPFTALTSSTRESRIGGLKSWFQLNNMKDGDEVIVQMINQENYTYRLISETIYIQQIRSLQEKFDTCQTEAEVSESLNSLTSWTATESHLVVMSEFYRLSLEKDPSNRNIILQKDQKRRESVPVNLKMSLLQLYGGHCQVCNFTFLKRDKTPYFEVHHIVPEIGNHPKNLLVVCANCHCQFEYAALDMRFNPESWLIEVKFTDFWLPVKQVLLQNELNFTKKVIIDKQ